MRKFFAAACCVIVVLQLLIAVPFVVCVVFFAYASADMNVQAQVSGPTYYPPTPVGYASPAVTPCDSGQCLAMLPAPLPPSPLAYSPAPVAPPAPVAMLPPPPADPWLPQPVQAPTLDVAPSPSQVAAIAEVRESLGSPLDGTSLADEPATNPLAPPTGTAPVADAPAVGPPADATISEKQVAGSCSIDPLDALLVSLRTSADHLYTLSQSLEADGNYDRADQLRKLARDIREEVGMISREHQATPPPPSPATVTAASFDPAVVPASHAVPSPPQTVPSPLEGARPIPIVEEEEEKLGIELPE